MHCSYQNLNNIYCVVLESKRNRIEHSSKNHFGGFAVFINPFRESLFLQNLLILIAREDLLKINSTFKHLI